MKARHASDHGRYEHGPNQGKKYTWPRPIRWLRYNVAGVSTAEERRVRELEQEVRELRRANEILKRAASFFGPELDRQHRK